MNKIIVFSLIVIFMLLGFTGCGESKETYEEEKTNVGKYKMPDEMSEHEGTWLQWPHDKTYGKGYKKEVESIWIEMIRELIEGENVHIVAYDEREKNYIVSQLIDENIDMDKVDFYIFKTDDVWARDNGPIFVYDNNKNLTILDWGFNGWGKKVKYKKDRLLRSLIGKELGIETVDLQDVVLEGGAIELDGNGTLI